MKERHRTKFDTIDLRHLGRSVGYRTGLSANDAQVCVKLVVQILKDAVERQDFPNLKGLGKIVARFPSEYQKVVLARMAQVVTGKAVLKFVPSKEFLYRINPVRSDNVKWRDK